MKQTLHALPVILAGLAFGCCVVALLFRLLTPTSLRRLGLVLLLPGPGLAFALAHGNANRGWIEGTLLTPAVAFPVAATLLTLPAGTARVATGLGAGIWTRLRLIWLPLLAPALLLSAMLATACSVTCALLAQS